MPEHPSSTALYTSTYSKPMNVVVFASGGGGNLQTTIDVAARDPDRIRVRAVVTDRAGIPAVEIAKAHELPVITRDFQQIDCLRRQQDGMAHYRHVADGLHDELLEELQIVEQAMQQPIDLIILSYRRIIRGALLDRFAGKMINQHPGDLSVMHPGTYQRRYVGINPVYDALTDGMKQTRTSCFLVQTGIDTGEILCSGALVPYGGPYPVTQHHADRHELLQKIQSDRPCLQFTLKAIADGRFSINNCQTHKDGCRVIRLDDQDLSYSGKELTHPPSNP